MPPPNDRKVSRDALLDRLKTAFTEWHSSEEKRFKDEAAFLRSVLKGRTGSERVARSNTAQAETLVVNNISTFLQGV